MSVLPAGVLSDAVATRRLLDRFGFGPRPGELDAARGGGFAATLDALLAPAVVPDPGVVATPTPDLAPVPRVTKAQKSDADAKQARNKARNQDQTVLTSWWLDRMWAAQHALPERLTWFWHGHFATSAQKVNQPEYLLAQNETFRRMGTGDFGALAHAMITDPAMLMWLDGQKNVVGRPNENLGREFMELFALGVGNYSETDVREAARSLTGWTINPATDTARFVPRRHDPGPKTILGRTAAFDAPSFVDLVLSRPESAQFVAKRLWFRLVSSTPPSPAVLGGLTDAYGPRRDVGALLRAIATSDPFHDGATTLVKQPVEWAVGLARAVGAKPSTLTGSQTQTVKAAARKADPIHTHLTALGQVPFRPPSVGGWPAGTAWLTPSAQLDRLALARSVVAHATIPPGPSGPNAQIEWARQVLGVDAFGPRSTDALRSAAGAAGADPRQVLTVAALTPEYVIST